ncbi:hypothetical protein HQ32_03081 [Prauserella sp. Am3]|nr:hypothetical protein HQ32_03081 [Prauserella sp. Am3]
MTPVLSWAPGSRKLERGLLLERAAPRELRIAQGGVTAPCDALA